MKIPNENQQREKLLSLLREIRQKKGVTQVELAQKLGVPQSFVSKYESGERQLDVLELRQICEVIGIPLDNFIRQLEEKINRPLA
jgi:transcriptional regulator with XRE-family HTH domain